MNSHSEQSYNLDKNFLIEWAINICSIAEGVTYFVRKEHPEYTSTEKRLISQFMVQEAMLRLDSAIVLLENGSTILRTKEDSAYIDPFSIMTLVRSIYEIMAFHHYYIYLPNEDTISDVLFKLWKMSGISNRLSVIPDAPDLKEKYNQCQTEYEKLKQEIEESEFFKKAKQPKIIKNAMTQLKLLKIKHDSDGYNVETISYENASEEVFKNTAAERNAKIIYKHLSSISHPSYMNVLQLGAHDGTFNKFTQDQIIRGIQFLKKLLEEMVEVIPEAKEYIENLSPGLKNCYDASSIK